MERFSAAVAEVQLLLFVEFRATYPPRFSVCTLIYIYFLNKFIYLIYLFLAALGLRCCLWAFSSCGERGLLFVVVHGLLIAVASLVAERGL